MKLPNRRPSETHKLLLRDSSGDVTHSFDVTVSWHPETGHIHEVFFVDRGKVGQGLDQILTDLGVQLSRVFQNRDPHTGEEMAA